MYIRSFLKVCHFSLTPIDFEQFSEHAVQLVGEIEGHWPP